MIIQIEVAVETCELWVTKGIRNTELDRVVSVKVDGEEIPERDWGECPHAAQSFMIFRGSYNYLELDFHRTA